MTTSSDAILHSPDLARLQIRPARRWDIQHVHRLARALISKDVASPRVLQKIHEKNRSTLLVVDEAMDVPAKGHVAPPHQKEQKAQPALVVRHAANDLDDDAVQGFIATLPLTCLGEETLRTGRFSGLAVNPDWIAGEGEDPAAVYIWGLAGATAKAKAAIWKSALHIERGIYPGVPYYATAGSQIGHTLLERLGYQRIKDTCENAPDNLFGRASHIGDSAAA